MRKPGGRAVLAGAVAAFMVLAALAVVFGLRGSNPYASDVSDPAATEAAVSPTPWACEKAFPDSDAHLSCRKGSALVTTDGTETRWNGIVCEIGHDYVIVRAGTDLDTIGSVGGVTQLFGPSASPTDVTSAALSTLVVAVGLTANDESEGEPDWLPDLTSPFKQSEASSAPIAGRYSRNSLVTFQAYAADGDTTAASEPTGSSTVTLAPGRASGTFTFSAATPSGGQTPATGSFVCD